MPCPYAERRGALIYCRVAGKLVNPLSYPCLSKTKYTKCRYYKKAAEAPKRVEPQAPRAEEALRPAQPVSVKPEPAEATVSRVRETGAPPPVVPPAEMKVAAPGPSQQSVATPRPKRTRGLTLDGRPARNCLECIYYGSHTKTCLLLGVEVRDPYDPPCAES